MGGGLRAAPLQSRFGTILDLLNRDRKRAARDAWGNTRRTLAGRGVLCALF